MCVCFFSGFFLQYSINFCSLEQKKSIIFIPVDVCQSWFFTFFHLVDVAVDVDGDDDDDDNDCKKKKFSDFSL